MVGFMIDSIGRPPRVFSIVSGTASLAELPL
jgi:hypothetical protein